MKKLCILLVIILSASAVFAQDWSGVLDSTINYTAGQGEYLPDHSFGFEQYANLRLRVRTREAATFNAAFNIIALSGNMAVPAAMSGLASVGPNYAAAMELERLFVRINGEAADVEAGLFRMSFGYGQVWGSMDFLNPRNPLSPNARPRGVMGLNATFFPGLSSRVMALAAAPQNPLEIQGGGIIGGLFYDQHWARASAQGLYAYETPLDSSPQGLHRFGLSVKADLELSLILDALYILDPQDTAQPMEGLSMGAGFDYSFFSGDLIILFEYLFNGKTSVSHRFRGGPWANHHYLYGTARYRVNDFLSFTAGGLSALEDGSFQIIIGQDYEIYQGFAMNLLARIPLDKKSFGGDEDGELGPLLSGTSFTVNLGFRLRF
ncbi:MAG: hypothetical protein FWH12_03945 [Treponema sp.]|nr:hypothetical protein [Treponema sp.]